MRIMLLAVLVSLKGWSTRLIPQKTVRRIRPTILPQPKYSLMRSRIAWLNRQISRLNLLYIWLAASIVV